MEFVSRLIGVFKKRVLVNAGAKPYISVKLQAGDSPLETLRQVFQRLRRVRADRRHKIRKAILRAFIGIAGPPN